MIIRQVAVDTHELAWAAGFFDGEGSFVIGKPSRTKQFRVQIAQIDPRPLERFNRAVCSLGNVSGPYKSRSEKHHIKWTFTSARFEHAQQIMILLWPYLRPIKRQQAKKAITEMLIDAREVRKDPNWRLSGVALWSKMRKAGIELPEGARLPRTTKA